MSVLAAHLQVPGGAADMFHLIVRRKFDAAHYLPGYEGSCANLHGHTWKVEVVLQGKMLNDIGILADFKEIKRQLESILPDHTCLNDEFFFSPTAEKIAEYIYNELAAPEACELVSVTVWESDDCGAMYTPS
jgi:6-pyruvoyltetrahydropterin/6-carboxytetrahydropterin synthase